MRTSIRNLISWRRPEAVDRPSGSPSTTLSGDALPSGAVQGRWSTGLMKALKGAIVGLIALLGTSMTPAAAQVWAPPPAWGPGWHHWTGHHRGHPGWRGPVWYAAPGPHHGWYRWHGRWYRHCGWRWEAPHLRVWRCY